MSKLSSKVLLEVLPVATVGVIGTLVINHYSRQPSPPIIVQAPPLPTEDALQESLLEGHDVLADYMQRNPDLQVKRQSDGVVQVSSTDPNFPPLPPVLEVRRAGARPAAGAPEKVVARPRQTPKNKIALVDPQARVAVDSPREIDPKPAADPPLMIEPRPSLGPSSAIEWTLAPVREQALYGMRPIVRVASVMRDWVGDIAALPGRALDATRSNDSMAPPAPATADLRRPY